MIFRQVYLLFFLQMFVLQPVFAASELKKVFTDSRRSKPFIHRLKNLDDSALDRFMLGRSFFSVPWVVAPSATSARDGLGPLFNANTCSSCHVDNGGGAVLNDEGQPLRALVFKLAQPARQAERQANEINIGDPVYGRQLAINGTGAVLPEATAHLKQQQELFHFPDGSTQLLTHFIPYLEQLNYGPLHPDTRIEIRQAPTLAGLGLVAQVDPQTIAEYADPDDQNHDGISGRMNMVYNIATGNLAPGKYGWKAGQPTITQQTADAAAHDMGLTNPLFPDEMCTPAQKDCLHAPRGHPTPQGNFDLPQMRLDAIAFYVKNHQAPQPGHLSSVAEAGKQYFTAIGCAACHRETLITREGVPFSPYSDYLLHDMGAALTGNRPEFAAGTEEWRTAPLWGIGERVRLGQRFLHDARAATPLEAILWHGGEAENAKNRFAALPAKQRQAILSFLRSL